MAYLAISTEVTYYKAGNYFKLSIFDKICERVNKRTVLYCHVQASCNTAQLVGK